MIYLLVSILTFLSSGEELVGGLEAYDNHLERQRDACRDLAVGESRKVTQTAPYNSTNPSSDMNSYNMHYVLTKLSDKKYKVHIPIAFKPTGAYGADNPFGDKMSSAGYARYTDHAFRGHVSKCLKKMNPKLKDSGGVQIELSIDENPEAAAKHGIGVHTVELIGKNQRSFGTRYSENIDCESVAHELLHLTGLCDEYHEKTMHDTVKRGAKNAINPVELGYKNPPSSVTRNFDCRAEPGTNSIMGDVSAAVSDEPKTVRIAVICQCLDGCETTPEFKKKYPEQYLTFKKTEKPPPCPAPFNKRDYFEKMISEKEIPTLAKNGPRVFLMFEKQGNAVLRRAHTRHIIYPGCREKNKAYYDCSSMAYENSDIEGCSDFQNKCRGDAWLD